MYGAMHAQNSMRAVERPEEVLSSQLWMTLRARTVESGS